MLDSYFFVPGDKQRFISKSKDLDATYIVFDLEDSVSTKNKSEGLKNLLEIHAHSSNHYVRIPFLENVFNKEELRSLIIHFHGNLVLPKVNSLADIEHLEELVGESLELNIILLIETPKGFINTRKILEKYSSIIKGIGFGSHDFSSIMKMKNTAENLDSYKKHLMVLAKAFEIDFIDSVDIDVQDFEQFKNETIQAFNQGADGKFIIHPEQLRIFNNLTFYSESELKLFNKVYLKMISQDEENIDILKIDGKIFEKPHLAAIKKIIEKKQSNGNK